MISIDATGEHDQAFLILGERAALLALLAVTMRFIGSEVPVNIVNALPKLDRCPSARHSTVDSDTGDVRAGAIAVVKVGL